MTQSYNLEEYKPYRVNLQQPELKLATFNPVDFEYKENDQEVLRNQMYRAEEADKENNKNWTDLKKWFSEQRKLVHNDSETYSIFDKLETSVNDKIKELQNTNLGSLHALGNSISEFTANAYENKTIIGMIQQNQKAESTSKEIDALYQNGRITDIRRNRLKHQLHTRFDNNFIKKDGEIIGVGDYNPHINIVEKIDPLKLSALIASVTSPESTTTGGHHSYETLIDKNGNKTKTDYSNGESYTKTTSWGGSHTTEQLRSEKLLKTYEYYQDSDPEFLRQITAEYEDLEYELQECTNRLSEENIDSTERSNLINRQKDLNYLFGKGAGGGGKLSNKEFFITSIGNIIKQQAYKKTSNTNDSGSSVDRKGGSGSNGQDNPITPIDTRKLKFGTGVKDRANTGYDDFDYDSGASYYESQIKDSNDDIFTN